MKHLAIVGGGFAGGDCAHARVEDTHWALMSCRHAIPMGKHAGYNAARDLMGLPLRLYRQTAYVTCLDLGDYGVLLTSGCALASTRLSARVEATLDTETVLPARDTVDVGGIRLVFIGVIAGEMIACGSPVVGCKVDPPHAGGEVGR